MTVDERDARLFPIVAHLLALAIGIVGFLVVSAFWMIWRMYL